jgi:hypothetical protein
MVKLWNQLSCPSTDEWIEKMCCIFIMEFYLAIIKKNEIMFSDGKWIKLKNLMLSEIS